MSVSIYVALFLTIVVLFAAVYWLNELNEGGKRKKHEGASEQNRPTIFVSVASYRDSQCKTTLEGLFKKAKYPERVFIGVCEQNEIGNTDDQCVNHGFEYVNKYKNNIRRIEISHLEAQGPTYARYFCSLLYHKEDFFLQIDSHSIFADEWDEKLVNMYKECEAKIPNAVFGGYPKTYEEAQPESTAHPNDVPVSCHFHFDNDAKMPELFAIQKRMQVGDFYPVPYTGAGFIFGPGKMVQDVPFDPELPYLFHGEELLYSARLYTYGYNIVIPYEAVVFHDYGRPGAPRFWDVPHPDYAETYEDVKKKLMYMLKFGQEKPIKLRVDLDRYGFGKIRSLEQFYEYADVDNINKVIKSKEKFCK